MLGETWILLTRKKEKANPSLFLNLGLFLLNTFYIIYWYSYLKNGCAEGNGALWNTIKTDKHYLSANLVNKTSVCCVAAQHRPLIMTANAVRTRIETHTYKCEAAVQWFNYRFIHVLFKIDPSLIHFTTELIETVRSGCWSVVQVSIWAIIWYWLGFLVCAVLYIHKNTINLSEAASLCFSSPQLFNVSSQTDDRSGPWERRLMKVKYRRIRSVCECTPSQLLVMDGGVGKWRGANVS